VVVLIGPVPVALQRRDFWRAIFSFGPIRSWIQTRRRSLDNISGFSGFYTKNWWRHIAFATLLFGKSSCLPHADARITFVEIISTGPSSANFGYGRIAKLTSRCFARFKRQPGPTVDGTRDQGSCRGITLKCRPPAISAAKVTSYHFVAANAKRLSHAKDTARKAE